MRKTPSFQAFLPTIIVLTVGGLGGLVLLMNFTKPVLGPRWLFFFLLVWGFTGVALPFAILINHRFPSNPAAGPNVIMRQSLWAGSYMAILGWLQYGGVLSGSLALIFLIGIITIEVFIRLWERSRKHYD